MGEDKKTNDGLAGRLTDIGGSVEKAETRSALRYGAFGALVAAMVGGGLYVATQLDGTGDNQTAVRGTSTATEFPNDTATSAAPAMPQTRQVELRTEIVPDPAQAKALEEMEARLVQLTSQLGDLATQKDQASIDALNALRASMDSDMAELKRQMAASKKTADDAVTDLTNKLSAAEKLAKSEKDAWDAQRRQLENQLRAAQNNTAQTGPSAEEIARLKAEEAHRTRMLQLEKERLARVNSGMIAFAAGGTTAAEVNARELSDRESFVAGSAKPVAISVSSKIAQPEITVVQGTIIQAALETAIDSSLPGTLRAVVSEDVHSFDGRNVLIPRGSKLFGEYQSDLTIADSRILVAWNRVVTPEGRTAVISSYGADDLGRSGTTGQVHRHFMKRFGAAAMISIIGAAPTLASDRVNNVAAQDALEGVGNDLSSQTASAIGEYLSIPPTIRVDQGARIAVILDRDVVMP